MMEMKTPTQDLDWQLAPVVWSDYDVSTEDKIQVIFNCQVKLWDISMDFIHKKPTNLNSYILRDMKEQKGTINKALSDIYDDVNTNEQTEIYLPSHVAHKEEDSLRLL